MKNQTKCSTFVLQNLGRTAAEINWIRQLKAGSAAQPEGCSACFVLVFVRIVMGLCRKTEERCHSSLSIQA